MPILVDFGNFFRLLIFKAIISLILKILKTNLRQLKSDENCGFNNIVV